MLTEQILIQLIIILLTVQFFGMVSRLIRQQWVIGEIIAGLALGPTLLGLLFPALKEQIFPLSSLPTLQTLGDIGLILYMFSLGARLDTELMFRQSRTAHIVSLSGILLPLLLGVLLGLALYTRLTGSHATPLSFSLLLGAAMSITAFPVLARLLAEKKMLSTKIGMLALTCASVDDIIAWCLLALTVATIHAQNPLLVAMMIAETALFICIMYFIIRPLFRLLLRKINSQQLQITLSILVLLCSTVITTKIGIHPVFSAFLTGVIMPRNMVFTEQIRSIDNVNNLLFLPLFFVFSGLRTQIGLIQSPELWLLCLIVFLVACSGEIIGGTLSGRLMGETCKEATTLGILMNTRGLVELIVLNIGYELGILSPTPFAMLVIIAILTTMMASPLLPFLGYRSHMLQNNEAKTAVLTTHTHP